MEFGSPSSCQKKGFGISFNQHITNTEDFLREWGGPYLSGVSGVSGVGYRPHIVQKLHCGHDLNVPSGYDARGTNVCRAWTTVYVKQNDQAHLQNVQFGDESLDLLPRSVASRAAFQNMCGRLACQGHGNGISSTDVVRAEETCIICFWVIVN
jgi:hypothetical protein